MATSDAIADLMDDVGPILKFEAINALDEDKCFEFVIEEGVSFLARLDDGRQCLVLEAFMGVPPAEHASSVYGLLLRTNALWEQTGGLRFGLLQGDVGVTMLLDLPIGPLDVHALASACGQFAERVVIWRHVIAGNLTDDSPEPAMAFGNMV